MICAVGLAFAQFDAFAGAAAIYRCESDRVGVVYSDRPCATDAAVHESSGARVTVYEAPPISERASDPRPKAASMAKAARKGAAAAAKQAASCAKLDQSLREVRTKLRTGYGVKEGERLKERQRQLAERRRAEKCR